MINFNMKLINHKSIRTNMILVLSISFLIIFNAIFITAFVMSKNTLNNVKGDLMSRIVNDAGMNISSQINEKIIMAKTIVSDEAINDSNKAIDDKLQILSNYCNELGIRSIGIMDTQGNFVTTDNFTNNIKDKVYFENVMNDKVYISSPQIDKKTGQQITFVAIPIKNDNKIIGGITCTFDSSFICDDIKKLQYFKSGTSYILDKDGNIVGADNFEMIKEGKNLIQENSNDKKLLAVYDNILQGKSGIEDVNGKIYAYSSVPDIAGWSIVMEVSKKEVYKEATAMGASFILCGLASITLLLFVIYIYAKLLGNRLNKLKDSIEIIAHGVFNEELDENELLREDEIGKIYKALKNTKDSVINILNQVKGDVKKITGHSEILSDTSREINVGSQNISEAMSQAAKGNTEQSEKILAINNEMNTFAENIGRMKSNIKNIDNISNEIQNGLNDGNTSIEHLNISVGNFDNSFESFNKGIYSMNGKICSIENITNAISSIAEQTNLLALNAAIEAARAGDAGKGFSVVAEEIRKLADKSKESVSEIGTIITNVLEESKKIIDSTELINCEVDNQKNKIKSTIESFNYIENLLNELAPKISEILTLSENNNNRKDSIVDSIQSATAISEELAASTEEVDATAEEFKRSGEAIYNASEELSVIIEELNESVNKFLI